MFRSWRPYNVFGHFDLDLKVKFHQYIYSYQLEEGHLRTQFEVTIDGQLKPNNFNFNAI